VPNKAGRNVQESKQSRFWFHKCSGHIHHDRYSYVLVM